MWLLLKTCLCTNRSQVGTMVSSFRFHKIRAQLSRQPSTCIWRTKLAGQRSFELANIPAELCNVRRTGPRSCHVICFSTDLYIICGLLLLYTINIVWYSDLLSCVMFLCIQKWNWSINVYCNAYIWCFLGCGGRNNMK